MLIFTHIEIGSYFYKKIISQYEGLNLKFWPFILGTILPDISPMARINHYYEETQDYYNAYSDVIKDPMASDYQRSQALGVLCHFICDYFCMFHQVSPYKELPLTKHLAYEFKLHLTMLSVKKKRPFIEQSMDAIHEQLKERIPYMPLEKGFLDDLINAYTSQKSSTLNDLTFSIYSVKQILTEVLLSYGFATNTGSLERVDANSVLIN